MTKEKTAFKFPEISDSDIAWACRQIGLPDDAFNPIALDTSRCDAIKSEVSVDIAACPGSGKTTLLVAKLAILARDWSSRTRGICVLSHTNVAKREVIERLGKTEVGSKLLHPPHFIGTIHSFANEFLSLPSLASIGKKPLLIDTETTIERRWMSIPGPVRDVLECRHIPKNKLICISANGDIQEFFNKGTPTFKSVQTVCRNSFNNGYLCYEEMLILANDLLNKHPNFNNILQRRFPIVFIDESQDTQSIQQALLNRIFPEHSQCIIQRLGDPNQAIYDSNSDDPDSNNFPIESRKISLPVSLRFNQKIADLSDPLGLIPYKMLGLGPRKKNACISDTTHTIFTFADQENAKNVLPEFGNMILSSFTDEMISTGTFKAIGRIHRGDSVKDGLPKSIPYYWPEYDSNLERTSPKPKSMADHVRFGISESQDSKESHHAIQAISQGIIKLAEMLNPDIVHILPEKSPYKRVQKFISNENGAESAFKEIITELGLNLKYPKESDWNNTWKPNFKLIAESISGKPLMPNDTAIHFISWNTDSPSSKHKGGNIFKHQRSGREVKIEVGSINSVKGETHTATLVMETFFRSHHLQKVLPWIAGLKNGGAGLKNSDQSRLKLAYVAMTRPTHLLCLAIPRSFIDKPIKSNQTETLREKLIPTGWNIIDLPTRAHQI